MSSQQLEFLIHRNAYYAETWRGPVRARDREYWIRPARRGWQVSWHNDQDDDVKGPGFYQGRKTRTTLEDAKELANTWHAERTRVLAKLGADNAPGWHR
jgi:hypothetical protein